MLAAGGDAGGCTVVTQYCSAGGLGATNDHAAGDGGNINYVSLQQYLEAGGGGGGLGRIRVNTPDMTYTRSSSSVEVGDISTGTLSTR
jgi:hypothetical protein